MMNKKEIKSEIKKLEKKLLKSYKAMKRDKPLRTSHSFELMKEVFTETYSGYKTIGLSRLNKSQLQAYYNSLKGIEAQEGSTYKEAKKRYDESKKRAKQRGMSKELIDFIEKNADSWEVFVNSKTFKDSVSAYEYESSLFDDLRSVTEEEKYSVFKHWLEEQEDVWDYDLPKDEAKDLFEYSSILTEDNWKEVLKRITEDW